MPTIEFEVWCICGEKLCNQCDNVAGGIRVRPCQRCLKEQYEIGYEDGLEEEWDE